MTIVLKRCAMLHASSVSPEPFNRWGVKDHFHVAVGSTALASCVASVVPPSGASSLVMAHLLDGLVQPIPIPIPIEGAGGLADVFFNPFAY